VAKTLHYFVAHAPKYVSSAQKNAKSMTWSTASVVPKSAENVLKNVGIWWNNMPDTLHYRLATQKR
jgi:hypothetical protein